VALVNTRIWSKPAWLTRPGHPHRAAKCVLDCRLAADDECMITEIPEKRETPQAPGGGGMVAWTTKSIAASSASQNFKALRFSGRLFFADRSRLGAAMSPARRSCWRAVRCHRQVARVFDWRSRRSQTCANLGCGTRPFSRDHEVGRSLATDARPQAASYTRIQSVRERTRRIAAMA